jgi:hypothetical protein
MKQGRGQGIIGPVLQWTATCTLRLRAALLRCHRTLERTETQAWTTWHIFHIFRIAPGETARAMTTWNYERTAHRRGYSNKDKSNQMACKLHVWI